MAGKRYEYEIQLTTDESPFDVQTVYRLAKDSKDAREQVLKEATKNGMKRSDVQIISAKRT